MMDYLGQGFLLLLYNHFPSLSPESFHYSNLLSFLWISTQTKPIIGTLQDVINFYRQQGTKMQELLVIFYAIEMLTIIESLHQVGIIHGDIKPDNFLVLHEE